MDLPPLPIDDALPQLQAALAAHASAVLVAPPGAGKTTRVPLALLGAPWRGDGRIVVLEPRRLAARAAARQMARLIGEEVGGTVGYRVRLDAKVSRRTRIELVTEGVFTRMILDDPELKGVAAVVFDEFHERSLDADLGLALALDAAELRDDLRLLVMSATLDGARVSELMDGAPVVESLGRAFPVETLYRDRDPALRLEEQVAAVTLEALRAQPGSALVFLPGQAEIGRVAERLAGRVPADVEIAPLYGQLSPEEQDRAVQPAPAGRRKVVLATSIAETSLTIEGVRIVVDGGYRRAPAYEPADRADGARDAAGVAGGGGAAARARRARRTGGLLPAVERRAGRGARGVRCAGNAGGGSERAGARPRRMGRDGPGAAPLPRSAAGAGLERGGGAAARARGARCGGADHRGGQGAGAAAAASAARPHDPPGGGGGRCGNGGAGGGAADRAGARRRRCRSRAAARAVRARARAAGRGGAGVGGALGGDGGGGWTAKAPSPDLRPTSPPRERWESGGEVGRHLARAYPDRVAQQAGARGRFRLANGRAASLEETDALAAAPYLVVADITGAAATGRHPGRGGDRAGGDRGTVRQPDRRGDGDGVRPGLAQRAGAAGAAAGGTAARRRAGEDRRSGTGGGGAGRGDRRDRGRGAAVDEGTAGAAAAGELSRGSSSGASGRTFRMRRWRPTWAGWCRASSGGRRWARSPRRTWGQRSRGCCPIARRQEIERLLPSHFAAPSGSRLPIDYAAENGPALEVRVQELFGLDRHPSVAGGKVPLLLVLLSPAHRPIQTTRDLPGFWRGSWRDVAKDLKGRYPRHYWPEDPVAAVATARAKPRGT